MGHGPVDRGGILRVVAGQHFQQQGAVFGGLAQRPDLVEAAGEGDQSVAAHAAVGGLHAGDAAEAGGAADRAARVAADGQRGHPRGHAGGRPAAGTAGNPREVPRVVDGEEGRVLVRPAHGELVHVGPSDQHGVGRLQLGDDRGIVGRAEVFQHPRGAGRRLALRAEHVFHGDRQPGQHPQRLASLAAAIDRLGLGQGRGRIDPQERPHRAVVPLRCGPSTPG